MMSGDKLYSAVTHDIRIEVRPIFLPEQSDAAIGRYIFAYHVRIANERAHPVQLLSRYWHITDGLGRVEEVEGPGVVGEQPVIPPGESYLYASGCPLQTPSGIMLGHYIFEDENGDSLKANIPPFSLDCPWDKKSVN